MRLNIDSAYHDYINFFLHDFVVTTGVIARNISNERLLTTKSGQQWPKFVPS